ncbi:MAG: gliding motility-associated C-terminal domain-containing protein [Saprospiraceae bacterium]|nr:gliding motility-associated C-terminal domain-containing protein [Saprospiraceae bacterium]
MSTVSNCNETGASVLIKFIDCPIEVEIIQINDCDNNGTPLDDTDDVYTVDLYVESDTTFQIVHEMNVYGPFEQNTQATLSLSADNVPDTLMIEAIGKNCFLLEVVNQNNCSLAKPDSLKIIVPNIFSPNGDNINDEWFVIVESDTSKILECSIFDRWGNKVYYSNDNNPIWNGQYQQNPVHAGVYIYVITYIDDSLIKKHKSGDITVIY